MPQTVSKTDPRIGPLRQLLRNLIAFRALYETDGISELQDHEGNVWSLWDLENFYEAALKPGVLPDRQKQAIQLFYVMNIPEDQVARIMGILPTNPIGMYGTSALTKLLKLVDDGKIINLWAVDNELTYA